MLFVWPKLIAAAYVLIFFHFLFIENKIKIRNFMIGISAALAMLSHGGSFFALLGIVIFWGCSNIKFISLSMIKKVSIWAVVFTLFMLPWVFYGKYVDPSYSRLIKWHLAGLIPPSEISLVSALHQAYSEITIDEWLDAKWENITTSLKGFILLSEPLFLGKLPEFISDVRVNSFYQAFYSFWFFSPFLALFCWLLTGINKISDFLLKIFISSMIGLLCWCLLMFIPGSTFIHQGSYFIWIGLFIFSQVVMWESSKTLFFIAVTGNFFITLVVYIFSPFSLFHDLFYIAFILLLITLFWKSLRVWSCQLKYESQ
jgi:hypothetical protein